MCFPLCDSLTGLGKVRNSFAKPREKPLSPAPLAQAGEGIFFSLSHASREEDPFLLPLPTHYRRGIIFAPLPCFKGEGRGERALSRGSA